MYKEFYPSAWVKKRETYHYVVNFPWAEGNLLLNCFSGGGDENAIKPFYGEGALCNIGPQSDPSAQIDHLYTCSKNNTLLTH